jgi:7-keto-8-aminopelargonate synthetase-like enzyme
LGHKGAGTAHHLGVAQDIDVIMGSFTKAFGSIGGFVVTNKSIADYLRITARSYIFSDPIIPAVVAGLIKTIQIIEEGDHLRQSVLANAQYLRDNLKKLNFKVFGEETPIVPLFIGSEEKAIKFSALLYENNILAPCIRRPAVAEGQERIRFSVMATHTKVQIDYLLENIKKTGEQLKII